MLSLFNIRKGSISAFREPLKTHPILFQYELIIVSLCPPNQLHLVSEQRPLFFAIKNSMEAKARFWRRHMSRQSKSGRGVSGYCQSYDLSTATFYGCITLVYSLK